VSRTYIPFHLDKTDNCTLYYDYKEHQFFKSPGAKQGSLVSVLSGVAGVIIYALFKDVLVDLGTDNPLSIAGFSFLISCLLTLAAMWGIKIAIRKSNDKIELVMTPPPKDILVYIQEGKKWLRNSMFIILFAFLFSFINILLLCIDPGSGILFFTNTVAWMMFFIFIWGVRPFKRITIYKKMKREIIKREQELI